MSKIRSYHIVRPPRAIRKAKLDNIALVPASLLFRKGTYQTIANNLPKGGVLICQTEQKQHIRPILEKVAAIFRQNGHFVKTLPSSILALP
jgi:spermidine synthase